MFNFFRESVNLVWQMFNFRPQSINLAAKVFTSINLELL